MTFIQPARRPSPFIQNDGNNISNNAYPFNSSERLLPSGIELQDMGDILSFKWSSIPLKRGSAELLVASVTVGTSDVEPTEQSKHPFNL